MVVDLEEVKSVTSVQTTCLTSTLHGQGYTNQPWALWTYASMDGKTWFPLSSRINNDVWGFGPNGSGLVSYGWRAPGDNVVESTDLVPEAETVAARYIRVDYEPVNWCLVDEIEVMGYDGIREGAVMANGTRVLDNPTREGGDYLKPGEQTDGIHDMVLLYNSGDYGLDGETGYRYGDWTPEKHLYQFRRKSSRQNVRCRFVPGS